MGLERQLQCGPPKQPITLKGGELGPGDLLPREQGQVLSKHSQVL